MIYLLYFGHFNTAILYFKSFYTVKYYYTAMTKIPKGTKPKLSGVAKWTVDGKEVVAQISLWQVPEQEDEIK